MPPTPGQTRFWIWRLSNPDMTDEVMMRTLRNAGATYCVFQLERGEEGGTLHYQGYVEFEAKKRVSALKKINRSIHWEGRNGTGKEASDYCKKPETRVSGPWEFGDLDEPEPGKRNDLEAACALVRTEGLRAVAEKMPAVFVRNQRGLVAYLNIMLEARAEPPTVTLVYGPSDAGKSRWARARAEGSQLYTKPAGQGFWFDNFYGQEHALLEEFHGKDSGWRLADFLMVIDRYDVTVPTKFGHVRFNSKHIYVTTTTHPRYWWAVYPNDTYKAVCRRFTRVVTWDKVGEEPKVYEQKEELVDFFKY